MSAARDRRAGVLRIIKRWCAKGRERPIQLVDVVSIDTANEEVNHRRDASIGYVSEDGRNLDVTFFPSWLEGTTSKPVEKSWRGLFPW